MANARVLIVDDSPTIRNIIKIYLMTLKLEIHEADSGTRALELCRLTPPNLVISDVNMPGMTGVELVTALRAGEGGPTDVPILLLTSETEAGLEERALRAGATEFIRKPVAAKPLIDAVRKHLKLP